MFSIFVPEKQIKFCQVTRKNTKRGACHFLVIIINNYSVNIKTESYIFTIFSKQIPDLCHSPTLNRRSVSIFNFCEEGLIPDQTG